MPKTGLRLINYYVSHPTVEAAKNSRSGSVFHLFWYFRDFYSNSDSNQLEEVSLEHILIDLRKKVYLLWRKHVFFKLNSNSLNEIGISNASLILFFFLQRLVFLILSLTNMKKLLNNAWVGCSRKKNYILCREHEFLEKNILSIFYPNRDFER